MSGSRVKILDNGIVNRDVSGLGADHFNDIDLSNAQQIEVVRGPSSLLYTNGAIGGIVNVVDNSIAQENVEKLVKIGLETQSVNDGDTQNIFYQDNVNNLNFSFNFKNTSLGNYDVPNGAIVHMEEEHHDDEDHDDHDEHEEGHDEHEENPGFLANSDFEAESMKFGVSSVGENGFIGFHMQILKAHMVFPSMEKAMRVMVTRSMVMRITMITTIMMSMKKKAMMNMRVKEFLQPSNQINLILEVLTTLMGSLLILLITSSEILTYLYRTACRRGA